MGVRLSAMRTGGRRPPRHRPVHAVPLEGKTAVGKVNPGDPPRREAMAAIRSAGRECALNRAFRSG